MSFFTLQVQVRNYVDSDRDVVEEYDIVEEIASEVSDREEIYQATIEDGPEITFYNGECEK